MKHLGDITIGVLILAAVLLLLTAVGCSGVSTQTVAFLPAPNSCVKVSAYSWNSAATAMPCFGADGKPIGLVQGTGQSPLDLFSSYANAAVLGAVIPLTAGLLAPTTTVTTGK